MYPIRNDVGRGKGSVRGKENNIDEVSWSDTQKNV